MMNKDAADVLGRVERLLLACPNLEALSAGELWETIPQTAKRYATSACSVRAILAAMQRAGFSVTARPDKNWRVNVRAFDRAYAAMFRQPFMD